MTIMIGKYWNKIFKKKETATVNADPDPETLFAQIDIFWQEEYPKMSFDQKVRHWLPMIHRGMRTQGEALGDPYSEFSQEGYEKWKLLEPDFDRVFEAVIPLLGSDFDRDEYERRIQAPFFIRNEM